MRRIIKLFTVVKLGGGIINSKLILPVLLFFSLALVLNVSASSAASVNQTNINTSGTSLDNITTNISTSNYATADNATTSATSIKSATVNTTNTTNLNSTVTANTSIKSATTNTSNLNNTQAAGAPVLVNGLTLAQLKDGTSRVQAFFNKYDRLPTYVSFGTRKIPIATFVKNIATQGLKINTVIVNGLNVAQLKDGISRVQAYYVKYGKLPTYVSFGTRKIPIATFEKNIATQGLKITTNAVASTKPDTSSVAALAKSLKGSTTYATAVNIFNWVRDNISYSYYDNTKYGAAGTLTHMTGNCCDTSNLLVALARDDGITARYVHGYCHFSSGWYGHVWAQLYVNGKWYNADAISYANSLGVIKNWNTATATIYGVYTTLPF
jgi:transglutaminase-like putative cysteine protease